MNTYKLNALGVEITRRCNKVCQHCMKGDAQNVTITTTIIDRIFEDIQDVTRLLLNGGEVLLELDKVEYFLTKAATSPWNVREIECTTNGTICNRKIVDLCEDFCIKKSCVAVIRISNDEFHDAAEYEKAYAYYKPLVDNANARIKSQGSSGKIQLLFTQATGEPLNLIYAGRATTYIDNGTSQYRHGLNVQYRIDTKHRIKVIDNVIFCALTVSANGNVCFWEETSYKKLDADLSIGNILKHPLSEMVALHNDNCMLLCSEADALSHTEAIGLDSSYSTIHAFLQFKNILCGRILELRNKARQQFPNVPAQDIISALPFPTVDEVKEIAEWIYFNDFPCHITDETVQLGTSFNKHIGTPEELYYFNAVCRAIMLYWDLPGVTITMPNHYSTREQLAFWVFEDDNKGYANNGIPPSKVNFPCNPNSNGDIDYTMEFTEYLNAEFERNEYNKTVDSIIKSVGIIDSEPA